MATARKTTRRVDNSEGLAGLLSAVLAQAAVIQSADNGVDGKANNLVAAALVLVPLLGLQLLDASHQHWQWVVVIPMALMLVTIFLVLLLVRSRKYAGVVVDLAQNRDYFTKPNDVLLAQLIEDVNYSNDVNTEILASKSRLFRWIVGCFLLGFVSGVAVLFVIN